MKIVCVAGGSYKSFYLNYFVKLKHCDLLIFNYGIIYDYILKDELFDYGIVTKELLNLAVKLKAVVVAGVNIISHGKATKSLIVCDGKKIYTSTLSLGVKICFEEAKDGKTNNKNQFVVGNNKTNFSRCHKIIFTENMAKPNPIHCSNKKLYIFINKHGVVAVNNKILTKRNNKVCVFNF